MGSLNKCEIIDGQKVLTPFVETNNGIINGMPIGSWISFEKDTAPNEEWIQAGTTFDADKYPELYLFLGGNVVPERFDHSRLGVYQSITLPTTSGTAMTMPYDGVLMYQPNKSEGFSWVYINGQNVVFDKGNVGNNSEGSSSALTVPFRKGDSLRVNQVEGSISKVAYYDKPLFIKASSATSIYTPSDAVRQVKDYVADYVDERIADTGSYSLNEIDTGKKWIDGSPIYRKVMSIPYLPNQEVNHAYPHGITDFRFCIKLEGMVATLNRPRPIWWNILSGKPYADNIIEIQIDQDYLYISTYTDRSNLTARIYIEYLKS